MTAQQDPTEGHSPLPWEIGRDGQNVMSMHRLPVASSAGPVGAPHPNAALIVRAVNEHAALQARVEELAGLMREVADWLPDAYLCDRNDNATRDRFEARINAALGQEGRDE